MIRVLVIFFVLTLKPCFTVEEIVIMGSGPAGLTAAIYAARGLVMPLVLEGANPGGQLTGTNLIENFPGFPEGVRGSLLMAQMKAQAEGFGARFLSEKAISVDFSEGRIAIELEGGAQVLTRALIIATGSHPKWLGIPKEETFIGNGVSSCATCDGFFYRGKEVAVIGGGDSALEEALYLSKLAKKVTLIHRREALRGSAILQSRMRETDNIEFLGGYVVEGILGTSKVEGLSLRALESGIYRKIPLEGVFIAIGHEPETSLFKGKLAMDNRGLLLTMEKTAKTNVPGVFAAGDVVQGAYRQAITAAGQGCMAAIDALLFLQTSANSSSAFCVPEGVPRSSK